MQDRKEIVIRKYEESDKKAVLELHELGLRQTGSWLRDREKWDADMKDIAKAYLNAGEFLIMELNNKIVGMGGLKKIDNQTGEIKRMRVIPKLQGKGYGKLLLERLESDARRMGFKKLILNTSGKATTAIGMYLKHGYKEVGREPLEEIGTENIHYEKMLR